MSDQFSTLLNYTLDLIGYSVDRISLRAKSSKAVARFCSEICTEQVGVKLLSAGSKAEGVSLLFASDQDSMLVLTDYICVDFGHIENDIFVIVRHMDESPPGYIKLRPLDIETSTVSLLNLFSMYIPDKDIFMLSSSSMRNYITFVHGQITPYQGMVHKTSTVAGPALAVTMNRRLMDHVLQADLYQSDIVLAIPYYSSSFLKQWKGRTRLHDWPSAETIREVSTTEGYVVPVGHKHSEEQNYEWRVCYTTGEQTLVGSLNEVQIKLYVLLKIINTCIIKPDVDCISSYMIKNVVMWVSESCRTGIFKPHNLTRMVLQSLAFLRNCLVYSNFLPNYMISERNLLFGKVDSQESLKLGKVLVELLNDGENIFLRCEKLSNAMFLTHANPALAIRFCGWRNEIEELLILMNEKVFSKFKPNMVFQTTILYDLFFEYVKDESCFDTIVRLLNLLSLDISTLYGNGFQSFEDISTWLNNLFS